MVNLTISSPSSTDPNPLTFPPYVWLLPFLAYPILAALLRHRRLRETLETFPYTHPRTYPTMTNSDAFHIQLLLAELEFPFTYLKALQFALFRTYGIPSISKLLAETREFSEVDTAGKRYTDTVLLISEFAQYHPTSGRSVEAIARMNYIHSRYQKAGKISDEDLLYTLSLFAWEPIRWIDRYEWRQLEEFEKCAVGTFWKGIGDAMGIPYTMLSSGEDGGSWRDGLEWLHEVGEWAERYEKEYMVPAVSNRRTAEQTVMILLWGVPKWAKGEAEKVVCALMDDRLRKAMMYQKPAQIYFILVEVLFTFRKLLIRYLFLPRPSFMRMHNTTEHASKDGHFFMIDYEAAPWYVKPTLWNRWGPPAWKSRLMGLPVPGDDGEKYRPNGFVIPDIGPNSMRGKGAAYLEESKERMTRMRAVGCPFARVKGE